jgi:hypothetical protein
VNACVERVKMLIEDVKGDVDTMCGKTTCVDCVMSTDEGCVWINLREALGV